MIDKKIDLNEMLTEDFWQRQATGAERQSSRPQTPAGESRDALSETALEVHGGRRESIHDPYYDGVTGFARLLVHPPQDVSGRIIRTAEVVTAGTFAVFAGAEMAPCIPQLLDGFSAGLAHAIVTLPKTDLKIIGSGLRDLTTNVGPAILDGGTTRATIPNLLNCLVGTGLLAVEAAGFTYGTVRLAQWSHRLTTQAQARADAQEAK